MKRKSSQPPFSNIRILFGFFVGLAGVSLALFSIGVFSSTAQAQQKSTIITQSSDPLVPVGFDCATVPNLGIDKQENLRAGAIMIACGLAQGGGSTSFPFAPFADHLQNLLAPLAFGGTDVDLITGTESGTHITQSETFVAANPDDPNQIMVAYNDSRGVAANPINISGASYSADGGNTFTRLTKTTGQSPFTNTFGDPVVLYNRPTGTWFTVWLDAACGAQGLGGYKSATPGDVNSWTHFCVHTNSADDRNSGWVDNNPSSPFYGRMYISFNDFNIGGGALIVRYSTDNGLTWPNSRTVASTFFRDVQITGDPATGKLFLASMNEMGGGLTNRANKMYVSSDGGNSWTNTYNGPTFAGPGRTTCASNSYFACMFSGPSFWRHMGWGQPAALNGVVSYVYDSRNTANGDPADVFYIRSTDGGVTFSAAFKLNTDTTTKGQWQPNISAASDGSLLAVWYDEREATATCVKGSTTVGCYKMYARRSTDNGLTWQPDMAFSDVQTPLPGQPDGSIVTEYAGDYDYSYQVGNTHLHTWTDGRVAISGASQQDPFFDKDTAGGGGGANLVIAGSRLTHGPANGGATTFDVPMPLVGPSGVEDRDTGGTYLAVFTFDVPVTSGAASIVGGTAVAGAPSFSGNEMSVPLTGVANAQNVTIHISGVNGGNAMADVPFGFLIADANASRLVDKPDSTEIRGQVNQPVTAANFRDDVIPDGVISRADATEVKTHRNESLP